MKMELSKLLRPEEEKRRIQLQEWLNTPMGKRLQKLLGNEREKLVKAVAASTLKDYYLVVYAAQLKFLMELQEVIYDHNRFFERTD
jgi:hypothetical protein